MALVWMLQICSDVDTCKRPDSILYQHVFFVASYIEFESKHIKVWAGYRNLKLLWDAGVSVVATLQTTMVPRHSWNILDVPTRQ